MAARDMVPGIEAHCGHRMYFRYLFRKAHQYTGETLLPSPLEVNRVP